MAINKQVYQTNGTNSGAIASGATVALRYVGRLRVRMTDAEMAKYGACNFLRIVNKSAYRARIHFTWGITPQKYLDIEANSIITINAEDGISFYGFDLENLDATNDIAAESVHYSMARIEQIPESILHEAV